MHFKQDQTPLVLLSPNVASWLWDKKLGFWCASLDELVTNTAARCVVSQNKSIPVTISIYNTYGRDAESHLRRCWEWVTWVDIRQISPFPSVRKIWEEKCFQEGLKGGAMLFRRELLALRKAAPGSTL